MLTISFVLALLSVSAAQPSETELEEHWANFKVAFNKTYNSMEEVERKKIFGDHVKKIFHHNLETDLGNHSYRVGVNEYADMTPEEFLKVMNGYQTPNTTSNLSGVFEVQGDLALPGTVDWRQDGLVTGVKNQKQCGSCWAFAATGALEGQNEKKTGHLVSLSEQNLVDCSGAEGDYGCSGGWPQRAFEYVMKNNGIDTEDSYPYTAQNGVCHYTTNGKGATCSGYVDLPTGDENALQQAAATIGPISVAIDASQWSFQLYKTGIYNEPHCTTNSLDHAVLIVGYGSENGIDYWLVKNSWGTSWGEKGYIKMSRNKSNQCGISTSASYPLI